MNDAIPSYLEPLAGFLPRKVAQVCVFFGLKQGKGTNKGQGIEKMKLIKLIYFADREFLRKYGDPITWDEFYSLPHGPICSASLNCINKVIFSDITDDFFLMNGNVLVPVRTFLEDELDELSAAELVVLNSIWRRHGHQTASQLRSFSHVRCVEYTEIKNGRIPIGYDEVLSAVGQDDPTSAADDIQSFRKAIALID